MKTLRILTFLLIFCVSGAQASTPALAFRIDEGSNINSFVRSGPVAAHLLLRSGTEPRILVAFPAGNSGVGLWFDKTATPIAWSLAAPPKPITLKDARGRALHGIEFEVTTDARELVPERALLSSIRVLRDFELLRKAPAEVLVDPRATGAQIAWMRDRLDGAAGFRLEVTALAGTIDPKHFASSSTPLRLRVRALTGETPLTPLAKTVNDRAQDDTRSRQVLEFLSYREKFLAGSWRFDTYFGRDTLMSALLLAPALEPEALESALGSVLDRIAPSGEVAHEEDIGEFAVLRNAKEGRGKIDTPIYDYGMVDDDFMLAPLAARALLDDAAGNARAAAFLARKGMTGVRYGDELVRNFLWVVERTAAFADAPVVKNLVGIKDGRNTGQWRDSDRGLAGGRYAYDVNTALVPAALTSITRVNDTGLLDAYLSGAQRRALVHANRQAWYWTKRAPALFETQIDASAARAAVKAYSAQVGVRADDVVGLLGDAPLKFNALSLDAAGTPIPVLQSDEGFRLLLTRPSAEQLDRSLTSILRPFPAGLMTGVGMVVANPVLASPAVQKDFDRYAYHGTVIWSWQQALMSAGIERQLARNDLPSYTHALLYRARAALREAIEVSHAMRSSELWSWDFGSRRYRIEPFGRPGTDADESNAAQLWSTVFLGLTPPAPGIFEPARTDTSPGS